jgi:hypothetical protein
VLRTLEADEQDQFWQVVSDTLESASADADFRSAIQIVDKDWKKVSEFARIRTENRFIESVREEEYDSVRKTCPKGALGTWARDLATDFILKDDIASAIEGRLCSNYPEARSYGFEYFFNEFQRLRPTPSNLLVWSLKKRLKDDHDQEVYNALSWVADEVFADENNAWVIAFKEAVEQFNPILSGEDSAPSAEISDDDIRSDME